MLFNALPPFPPQVLRRLGRNTRNILNFDTMKRRIWYFLFILSLMSFYTKAQQVEEGTIKKMLQGLWKLASNDSITLAISGDTVLECNTGTHEMDLLSFKLSKQPCDNEEFVKSATGYYLTLLANDNEDVNDALCGALRSISNKEFRLLFDEHSMAIFEKLQ